MHFGAGSVLIGKYRLERPLEHPLSRGGMGSVWVARHLQLGTPVAVKFMDPAYAESAAFRTRFEREARAAAQLETPHVVRVHDFGFHETVPYLVMELLQGEDLNIRLLRRGRLPLLEAHRILAQTGEALRSAHDAGLVHRDLKPANLFLARVDGEDEDMVKLLDFGIAKETTSKLLADASTIGKVMGPHHYISPEQLRAERDLDARSDLWALGVILFRMVTGRLPFPGDVLAHVMTRILVDPIFSPTQLDPDLPPAIDAFFHRALTRDPARRFQSVREMVDEFARAAGAPPFTSSLSNVRAAAADVAQTRIRRSDAAAPSHRNFGTSPEKTVSDTMLVTMALTKDRRAVRRLVGHLEPVIHARAARLLLRRGGGRVRDIREEVRDLVQHVFAHIFAKDGHVLRQWDAERGLSLQNFVGLVAEREVASLLRNRRQSPWQVEEPTLPETLEHEAADTHGPEQICASREMLVNLLAAASARLSEQAKNMFQWLIIEERSVDEVCALSGKSADAVYAWRIRLKRLIEELIESLKFDRRA